MHLPAGPTTLRVRNDDAMQLAFHANDARDIFRKQVLGYDTNDGAQNRAVTVEVAQEGLYAFRLLQAQWNLDAGLEFYTDSPGGPVLVNGAAELAVSAVSAGAGDVELSWTPGGTLEESPDLVTAFAVSGNQDNPQTRSTAGAARGFFRVRAPQALPVYRGLTVPTRPYVSGISPSDNQSGVDPAAAIVVTMENRGTASVTMTVEGSTVVPVITEAGSTSTLTYTPPAPFAGGQEVNVGLTYGNAEALWSFVIETGSKALMFGARGASGDDWVALAWRRSSDSTWRWWTAPRSLRAMPTTRRRLRAWSTFRRRSWELTPIRSRSSPRSPGLRCRWCVSSRPASTNSG